MNREDYIQHTAFLREAQLSAGLIGSGLTALGKATHAEVGYYHQAFFGLSIGIERLCKLLVMADTAVRTGAFPTRQELKNLGHDLHSLLNVCESIGRSLDPGREYSERPATEVHGAIVRVLTEFATSSRYYNLDFLVNPSASQLDPVAAWWKEVGERVCKIHYGERERSRDESQALAMSALMGQHSMVFHTAESGEAIDNFAAFMSRGGASRVVQRYGRLYSVQIVRWLSSMACCLSRIGGYEKRIAALFGFEEPFVMFNNNDSYIKSRKIWDIYRL